MIEEGKELNLQCQSHSVPSWSGPMEGAEVVRTSYSLVMRKVKEENAGRYFCFGDDRTRGSFVANVSVYIGSKCNGLIYLWSRGV